MWAENILKNNNIPMEIITGENVLEIIFKKKIIEKFLQKWLLP